MQQNQELTTIYVRVAESIVRQRLGAGYAQRSAEVLTILRQARQEAIEMGIWFDAIMLADVVMDRLPAATAPLSAMERLARAATIPAPAPPPAEVTVTFTQEEWNAAVDGLEIALARAPDREMATILIRTVEKMQAGHIAAAGAQ